MAVDAASDAPGSPNVVVVRARWLSDDVAVGLARCPECGAIAPVGRFGAPWQYGPHRKRDGTCPYTAHQFIPDGILRGRRD